MGYWFDARFKAHAICKDDFSLPARTSHVIIYIQGPIKMVTKNGIEHNYPNKTGEWDSYTLENQ